MKNTIAANSTDERKATLTESILATIQEPCKGSPTLSQTCLAHVPKATHTYTCDQQLQACSFPKGVMLCICVRVTYRIRSLKTFGHQTSWRTPVNVLYFLTCTCMVGTRSKTLPFYGCSKTVGTGVQWLRVWAYLVTQLCIFFQPKSVPGNGVFTLARGVYSL